MIGPLAMGGLSDWFGLNAPIFGGALLCLAFTLFALRWRPILETQTDLHFAIVSVVEDTHLMTMHQMLHHQPPAWRLHAHYARD